MHDEAQPPRSDGDRSGSPVAGPRLGAVSPPSLLLGVVEQQRAVAELAGYVTSLPVLRRMPRGDGHPVLVLPGFLADDRSTVALRSVLRSRGHAVHRWGLGRNLGPRPAVFEGLVERLDSLYRAAGVRVSLVGWSLGGVYARVLARRHPEAVRQVITLGSPFRMRPSDRSNASIVFEALNPTPHLPLREEVVGSHCGLGHNPAAVLAVGDRLAQPEGSWRPFAPPRQMALLYPPPAWWHDDRQRASA